jgi:hypothetical protein
MKMLGLFAIFALIIFAALMALVVFLTIYFTEKKEKKRVTKEESINKGRPYNM